MGRVTIDDTVAAPGRQGSSCGTSSEGIVKQMETGGGASWQRDPPAGSGHSSRHPLDPFKTGTRGGRFVS
jgi:hypothetical protein